MDNVHDMGGMQAFGPVNAEPEDKEPVFHADWERHAFAVTMLSGFLGKWNIDMSRHARECQNPINYLRNTYYENWLAGTETLLVNAGLVSPREMTSGKAEGSAGIKAPDAQTALDSVRGAGGPIDASAPVNAAFAIGDRVRVRTFHPIGHTRAPRYVRGRIGVIDRCHGRHIFPDTHSNEHVEDHPLYSVRFDAVELWGPQGDASSVVYADLWEPYLEKA